MHTDLDPNITALFESQSAPPGGEQFVKKVSSRIGRERLRRSLAKSITQRISAVALMVLMPVIVTICRILAVRLEPVLSNITADNGVPVTYVLPGMLAFILIVYRINRTAETE